MLSVDEEALIMALIALSCALATETTSVNSLSASRGAPPALRPPASAAAAGSTGAGGFTRAISFSHFYL